MSRLVPLHHLALGRFGKVSQLTVDGNTRRRMLDLGLICGTRVEDLQKSP